GGWKMTPSTDADGPGTDARQPPPYPPPHAGEGREGAGARKTIPRHSGFQFVWKNMRRPGQSYSRMAVTSMAFSPDTKVKRKRAPIAFSPGGTPSRSNANQRRPGGAPGTGSGSGSAQSAAGPSANRSSGAAAGATVSTTTRE